MKNGIFVAGLLLLPLFSQAGDRQWTCRPFDASGTLAAEARVNEVNGVMTVDVDFQRKGEPPAPIRGLPMVNEISFAAKSFPWRVDVDWRRGLTLGYTVWQLNVHHLDKLARPDHSDVLFDCHRTK